VRAAVGLFVNVPSWPAEGFSRFQQHCSAAGRLRQTIVGPGRAAHRRTSSTTPEAPALGQSLAAAAERYPVPFQCAGVELRREVDPKATVAHVVRDIMETIRKGWAAYEQCRLSLGRDMRFCSPLSLQRPRPDWCEPNAPFTRDATMPSRMHGLPGQQFSYAVMAAEAIRQAREEFGPALFDRAVGSIDVSGIEIAHATWPYVAAATWLTNRVGGWRDGSAGGLLYTAHAGESFERGFSGVRTIGELFLGGRAPDRIGHASALDPRMRREVAKQHRNQNGRRHRHRFHDILQDLCYWRHVLVNNKRDTAACDEWITRVTSSAHSLRFPIDADKWMRAFENLHSAPLVDWAVGHLQEPHVLADDYLAKHKWSQLPDALADKDTRHAMQLFAWGAIRSDEAARTPGAAKDGLAENTEEKVCAYLEDHAAFAAEYVRGLIHEHNVLIETCPTSNLVIAGIHAYEDHPLWDHIKKDTRFSVNSDDPLVFGGFAGDELRALQDAFLQDQPGLKTALREIQDHPSWHATRQPADQAQVDAILKRAEAVLPAFRSCGAV
jgi:hypothetical protein